MVNPLISASSNPVNHDPSMDKLPAAATTLGMPAVRTDSFALSTSCYHHGRDSASQAISTHRLHKVVATSIGGSRILVALVILQVGWLLSNNRDPFSKLVETKCYKLWPLSSMEPDSVWQSELCCSTQHHVFPNYSCIRMTCSSCSLSLSPLHPRWWLVFVVGISAHQ